MRFLYPAEISSLNLSLMVAGAVLCLAAYALRPAYYVVRYTREREIIGFRWSVIVIALG
jgi:hypothetical protein